MELQHRKRWVDDANILAKSNFIQGKGKKKNICRGRAFAPLSRNSPLQSSFANALPSLLLQIADSCDLGIVGECWRFRAEHSQFEMIAEFIDYGGNALPLQDDR
ncbi:hypothetical protein [Pseudanabaena sp. ABRG5-3]|uniref:hypothetical protein n=1 Tax=Pseudanabaena sp. ABRG5-3 TaxID=685565 RepID=UPI000F82C3D2|nr:hypothetical protein [Pseudanabaena sp. ABRG5-3]